MSAPAVPRPDAGSTPTFVRALDVEARRAVDDRAGFGLLAAALAIIVLGTVAVATLGSPGGGSPMAFMLEVSFPLAVALPLVAILLVTSGGRRGPQLGAKALVSAAIAVGVPLLVFLFGALGVLGAAAASDADVVWDVSAAQYLRLGVFAVLAMAAGFVVGVAARTRSVALIAYAALLVAAPLASGLAGALPDPWQAVVSRIDLTAAMLHLHDATMSGAQWGHLAAAAVLWLGLPAAVVVRRALTKPTH